MLWSRTFSDEVDFRGAADAQGNVYWVEYDPPPTFQNPDAPPWLVSANRDGENRYRVRISVASLDGVFLLAGDKVVLSKGMVLAAYDASSGAAAWSIDLRATYRDGYSNFQGIADLGNGKLAFAVYDYNSVSGLYVADLATGAIAWFSVTSAQAGSQVLGADGAGLALAAGNGEVFVFDASGRQGWHHPFDRYVSLLSWSAGAPWLIISGTSTADYVAAPPGWFSAVEGTDLGFALSFGTVWSTPIAVNIVQGGAVVAQGPIAGTTSYNGISSFPFIAGDKGDHLILLSQNWHSIPALCHPSHADAAVLSRFDATTSYQCPFTWDGESAIEGAALLDGRVILGRRTYLTNACTHDLQPVTIEAYGLPGESLAPSGWVQRGGSPGLGMRPLR